MDYYGHFLVGVGIMLAILANFRIYERKNFLSYQQTLRTLIKAAAIWVAVYLGLSLILKFNPPISRIYTLTALATLLVILPAWRWMFWQTLRSEKLAARLRQRALVIGWSDEFSRAFNIFGAAPHRHFDVCGVVKPPSGRIGGKLPEGIRPIGRYGDLKTLLKMKICDVVLVADTHHQNGELIKLASLCEKEMVDFKLVPTCFRVLLSGLHLESFGGIPVLGISRLPLHSVVNQYVKRAIDIFGALVGLFLSAPIIACFGTMIYLESPGSIFYRQRRLGANGRTFDIIKLRSMRLDAEKGGKPRLDGQGRSPGSSRREIHAPVERRRTPPVLERAQGRNEPGGPAPGTARTDREFQGGYSPLQRPPSHQAGHHRLGPGQRPPG